MLTSTRAPAVVLLVAGLLTTACATAGSTTDMAGSAAPPMAMSDLPGGGAPAERSGAYTLSPTT
jgi:hypothetical protein